MRKLKLILVSIVAGHVTNFAIQTSQKKPRKNYVFKTTGKKINK